MSGLNNPPPIGKCALTTIRPFIPDAHWALVNHLWENHRIPLASLKMENDLRKAIGITFTMAGYRYAHGRRCQTVQTICSALGNSAAGDLIINASEAVRKRLSLMCTPIEVIGFDVSPRNVRQIKAYIRTNISNERFENRVIACDATTKEGELAAVSEVMYLIEPARRKSILHILETLQQTKGALEGIAIDLEENGADVKLYFLPRRTGNDGETYTTEQTKEFVDQAMSMFGLDQHRSRAHTMIDQMTALGLRSSFLAVEQKPNGLHEVKIDFNTARSGDIFPDRRVPPDAAARAIRSAYHAAGLNANEEDIAWLSGKLGRDGVLLDDFTTDFGADGCSGKVYLRGGRDQGCGVSAISL